MSELRIYNFEPTGIMPAECGDQNGIIVIRQLFAGLVSFDPDSGAPVNLIAESITSADNTVWQIVLKPGFAFSNGEPVTARSFVDAWNFAAYGPREFANAGFFERIAGFADLQGSEPAATEMSGLRVTGELGFEVTLTGPFPGFRALVGYSAFFPMASVCLADFDLYREAPIGNGPYQIVSWEHKCEIALVRHDGWGGEPAKADRLVFTLYPSLEAGYAALVDGEHDLMDNIPAESYVAARRDFAGRIFEQASNSYSYLGVPLYDERFRDKRVRQALSLAINREEIIERVYEGQYLPARGVISPNFLGYRPDLTGYCTFDPERARELLAEAGGWPGGKLVLHANVGGGHEPWLELVGQQITEHLGIETELDVSRAFADYFEQAKQAEYQGLFRRAWAPDYAWADSYLRPIFARGGSANQQFYDNPDFDALLAAADAAPAEAETVRHYQAAEDLVLEEMPIIPLWFQKTSIVYSERITTYARNIINGSDYSVIEVG
ncbi:peptide ABC transporter substrate-binding protein [Longispora albida]|uniref:peptide ABC transporter substrate-binding protein n=1 Tax=Longispora albida TaxID=203523 RepID=UPI00037B48C6|nr:ABC transporter substrate-binding protein [Longispora albida]